MTRISKEILKGIIQSLLITARPQSREINENQLLDQILQDHEKAKKWDELIKTAYTTDHVVNNEKVVNRLNYWILHYKDNDILKEIRDGK